MSYQFKGKLIKLATHRRRLPNGHVSDLEVVEHPGAILIVPFLDRSHLIFLRQYRAVLQTYLYELPAGTLKSKEKILVCAQRELIEETGYKAGRFKKLGKIFPVPGYSTELIHIFRGDNLVRYEKNDHAQDADELIQVVVFSFTQIKSLFKKGKITDAKTICALAFAGIL